MNRVLLSIKLDRYIRSIWPDASKDIGIRLEEIVHQEDIISKRIEERTALEKGVSKCLQNT